jgi:predicted metal-dependent phosphotriesterase family hydrolase
MAGQVQTVLGNVAPEKMGQVLMHEHLLVDARVPSE